MTVTVWRAGPNGVAHAVRRGRPRTLCGLFVLGERFAWPTVTRCDKCAAAEAVLV